MEDDFFDFLKRKFREDKDVLAIDASERFMLSHSGTKYDGSGVAYIVTWREKECLMNLVGLQMPFKKYFTLTPMSSSVDIGYGCGCEVRFDYDAETNSMVSSLVPYADMYID